jgi:hypothetical protein
VTVNFVTVNRVTVLTSEKVLALFCQLSRVCLAESIRARFSSNLVLERTLLEVALLWSHACDTVQSRLLCALNYTGTLLT